MPLNAKTLLFMRNNAPGERILDGAPAKCRSLDERAMQLLEKRLGGTREVYRYAAATGSRVTIMEANWVATNEALYYVHYNADSASRWAWSDVEGLLPERKKRFFPTSILTVKTKTETMDWTVGRSAVERLLHIYTTLHPAEA